MPERALRKGFRYRYRTRGFYDRLGFEVLPVPDPESLTYLGMRPRT